MLYRSNYQHGGDIYAGNITLDFSVNINPFGIPDSVRDAMYLALGQADRYPDPYCREALSAISERECISQKWILMGNGAAELIYSYCRITRSKTALIPVPTFTEYESAMRNCGCRVIYHWLAEDSGFLLDDKLIWAVENKKPDVIFLCNPNNPTGKLADRELIVSLLNVCREAGTRVFLDECFLDLADPMQSMTPLTSEYPNLFILKAFTKNYALAGVRVGYGSSSDTALLGGMSEDCQPWNVSVIAQAAAASAMKETDFLRRTREFLETERTWMEMQLKSFGFRVISSDANYLLFRGPAELDMALLQKGILIRNCRDFVGLSDEWFRVAVRLHSDNSILMEAIEEVIREEGVWQ